MVYRIYIIAYFSVVSRIYDIKDTGRAPGDAASLDRVTG